LGVTEAPKCGSRASTAASSVVIAQYSPLSVCFFAPTASAIALGLCMFDGLAVGFKFVNQRRVGGALLLTFLSCPMALAPRAGPQGEARGFSFLPACASDVPNTIASCAGVAE
jgi:hypothetical protein